MSQAPGVDRHEMVSGRPDPRLRGVVMGYTGYVERTAAPLCRLEVAVAVVPMILSFGPVLAVDGARHRSFVAGLADGPTLIAHDGEQFGLEVNLTPLGARRLLGIPMSELARRVVALEDLLPHAELLLERLAGCPAWPQRFRCLDEVLLARLERAPRVSPEVIHVWRRLRDAHGRLLIEPLATEIGWSRHRLAGSFQREVGLPPKTVARIMRFDRVVGILRDGGSDGLADAAYGCGYADQPHLNRDFRALAGTTPTDFARRLRADGDGVAGDGLLAASPS